MTRFICENCGHGFTDLFALLKHERINHDFRVYIQQTNNYRCSMCLKFFKTIDSFTSHIRKCDKFRKNIHCTFCDQIFDKKSTLIRHLMRCSYNVGFSRKSRLPSLKKSSKFMLSKVAFKAFLQQYELFSEKQFKDAVEFFTFYKSDIKELIEKILEKLSSIKIQFCLSVSFAKETEGIETYTIGYFCSENYVFNNLLSFESKYSNLISFMENEIQEFTDRGSGWYINDIDRLDIRIGEFNPLLGACHSVQLPKIIAQ